jgi:hypothetical protein
MGHGECLSEFAPLLVLRGMTKYGLGQVRILWAPHGVDDC